GVPEPINPSIGNTMMIELVGLDALEREDDEPHGDDGGSDPCSHDDADTNRNVVSMETSDETSDATLAARTHPSWSAEEIEPTPSASIATARPLLQRIHRSIPVAALGLVVALAGWAMSTEPDPVSEARPR